MIVLGKEHVEKFKIKHSAQRSCLATRIKVLEDIKFIPNNDLEMKSKFGKCFDRVGRQIVLDACGNNVRIIGKTDFDLCVFKITHVLTHVDYDKNKWKEKEGPKDKHNKKSRKKKERYE